MDRIPQCFDQDSSVFFRAKIARNGDTSFQCLYTTISNVTIVRARSISGCRQKLRIYSVGLAFLSSQGCISAPELLLRHSLAGGMWMWMASLGKLTGVSGHVNHCGLLLFDGGLSMHALPPQTMPFIGRRPQWLAWPHIPLSYILLKHITPHTQVTAKHATRTHTQYVYTYSTYTIVTPILWCIHTCKKSACRVLQLQSQNMYTTSKAIL